MKHSIFTVLLSLICIYGISQTTHTVNLPASGTATINVNCSVGDVLLFKSTSKPLAIVLFRNPTPNFTVTPTGNSTTYTVTATDTSYSSIVSLFATFVGKIILSTPTSISKITKDASVLAVFPNPTTSFINVSGLKLNSQLYIYDVTGKQIFETEITPLDNKVDISSFKAGVYIVRCGYSYIKVVKE